MDFDMQSVLSEVDKESLDAAMKMMGQSDLKQVEDEVSNIDATFDSIPFVLLSEKGSQNTKQRACVASSEELR